MVFVQISWREESPHGFGRRWRPAVLAVLLVICCGAGGVRALSAEEAVRKPEAEQSGAQDHQAKEQPKLTVGPPAQIEGFRQARFGMSEEQVRQAIRKDFPAAGKLTSAVHPSEKTTVLSLSVADLLPHTGNAHISYILGYRSKKLSQVNIVWTSDGTAAGDETIVGMANSLRDYFASESFKPENIVVNHKIAENAILVFRGSDDQKRTVLLLLSGVAGSVRSEEKKASNASPLTLELSYIEDAAHPDVFKIGKGQF